MAEAEVGGLIELLTRYGYLIVFVAAVAEAMPFVGWFVPGQAIIIIAGALAAGGYLNLLTIILIAIPAGIAGDAVGYYIGKRYGRAFIEKYGPRFRISPRHIQRSDELFSKYGPFALILARFSFLTRAVGPILAGMARMRPAIFWPVNVVGGVAWGVAYAALGYAFGISFIQLQGIVGKILAWTALAVVGLYVFYRFLRKYAAQFTRDDLYVAIAGSASGTIFGILADQVQKVGAANAFDVRGPQIVDALAPLADAFRAIEIATSTPILGAIALGLTGYFFLRRQWWEATLVALGMGGIILAITILRPIFADLLPPGPGDSFPSAAAVPLVLAGVVTYLVAMRGPARRVLLATLLISASLAVFVGLSRVAQGTEHPSSAIAGMALGAAWLSVTVLVVEFRLKGGKLPPRGAPETPAP